MIKYLAMVAAVASLACSANVAPIATSPAATPADRMSYPTSTQNGYFVNLDAITYIECDRKDASGDLRPYDAGTGSIIGHDRVLTAAHVVRGTDGCVVKDQTAKVIYQNDKLDVAVLQADLGDTPVMPISCDGFAKDNTYFAIGYAQGQDFALQVLTAIGEYHDVQTDENLFPHGAIFHGRIFHGMSGGPVIDNLGRVTGVIVAGNEDIEFAAIRDLADTPLCEMLKPVKDTDQ